ncbi:hypothetical protein ACN2XU_22805 [Primorskyibacter sp. 2E107]|uniref:hypothetical protein n=1 Tax=Primorskyibacter sp. 2E107 TaxID=3403458 RepID=UPI003AF9951B
MSQASKTQISTGDIVSFRFPFHDREGDYPRPSLVLDATDDELLLAYGTSSDTDANGGYEIRLRQEFAECGLDRESRFVLTRRLRVPRTDARLKGGQSQTPVIGSLTEAPLERARMLYDRIASTWSDDASRIEAERRGLNPRRQDRRRSSRNRFQV